MTIRIDGTTGISGIDGSVSQPSYVGVDTNTGIFFPAADTIAFVEGGTEAARINSSGNLGIGTNNPTEALTVIGNITTRAAGIGTTTASLRTDSDAPRLEFYSGISSGPYSGYSLTLGYRDANSPAIYGSIVQCGEIRVVKKAPLILATNNTEALRIDSNGNIGIGTTNPQTGLHVTSSAIINSNPTTGSYLIDRYVGFFNDPGSYPEYMLIGRTNTSDVFRIIGNIYGYRGAASERNIFFNICCSKTSFPSVGSTMGNKLGVGMGLVNLTYSGNTWIALQSTAAVNSGGLSLWFTGQMYHSYSSTQWTHADFYGSGASIPASSVSGISTIIYIS